MNLKKVANIIDAKYKLSINKIHMSGNLSNMNENIAFEAKAQTERRHSCMIQERKHYSY